VADFVAKVCGLGGSNFFRVVEAPFGKNMWGSTQRGTQATRDSPSRVARPSNRAFSSRRLARRFFDTPFFGLTGLRLCIAEIKRMLIFV